MRKEKIDKRNLTSFQECYKVIEVMEECEKILVNLDEMSLEDSKRSIFFLAGAIFARKGEMKKVNEREFLFYFS